MKLELIVGVKLDNYPICYERKWVVNPADMQLRKKVLKLMNCETFLSCEKFSLNYKIFKD